MTPGYGTHRSHTVRNLFFDYNSAFNTIQSVLFGNKLYLGVHMEWKGPEPQSPILFKECQIL